MYDAILGAGLETHLYLTLNEFLVMDNSRNIIFVYIITILVIPHQGHHCLHYMVQENIVVPCMEIFTSMHPSGIGSATSVLLSFHAILTLLHLCKL